MQVCHRLIRLLLWVQDQVLAVQYSFITIRMRPTPPLPNLFRTVLTPRVVRKMKTNSLPHFQTQRMVNIPYCSCSLLIRVYIYVLGLVKLKKKLVHLKKNKKFKTSKLSFIFRLNKPPQAIHLVFNFLIFLARN